MTGVGIQVGPLRPDYGDGWADLECDECKATWTGPIGESCWWCERAEERMRIWQGEMVLKVPEVDRDDRTFDDVMGAWFKRLKIAVDAGLIDEMKARNAWERATNESTAQMG